MRRVIYTLCGKELEFVIVGKYEEGAQWSIGVRFKRLEKAWADAPQTRTAKHAAVIKNIDDVRKIYEVDVFQVNLKRGSE